METWVMLLCMGFGLLWGIIEIIGEKMNPTEDVGYKHDNTKASGRHYQRDMIFNGIFRS